MYEELPARTGHKSEEVEWGKKGGETCSTSVWRESAHEDLAGDQGAWEEAPMPPRR